jgi:hypothetical protein
MTVFAFPRLTAAVTAAALAVSGLTATPAAAMNDNDRAALGLILGLGVLAAIADNNNDRRNDHRPPPPRHDPPRPRPGGFYPHDGYDRHADACTIRVHRDRYGRRVEVMSPGCFDDRGHRRGPEDWRDRH